MGKRMVRLDSSSIWGHQGFSLAEVMVVIAILGILSAIAIPNIIKYRENTQLRASATELLGTFRKAQIYAVKNNQKTTFDIDETAGTVTVKDSGGKIISSYAVHPGCKIDSNFTTTPGFTPMGLPLKKVIGSVEVRPLSSSSKIAYKVSLSMAGHTKLYTSTDGGSDSSWK